MKGLHSFDPSIESFMGAGIIVDCLKHEGQKKVCKDQCSHFFSPLNFYMYMCPTFKFYLDIFSWILNLTFVKLIIFFSPDI